jgi:hypothetical protein
MRPPDVGGAWCPSARVSRQQLGVSRRLLPSRLPRRADGGGFGRRLEPDRATPWIIPDERYFSMPSTEVGADVRRNLALNCCPWVRSLTHSPFAVIHSPAEIVAAWPITVTSSRCRAPSPAERRSRSRHCGTLHARRDPPALPGSMIPAAASFGRWLCGVPCRGYLLATSPGQSCRR